MITLAGLVVERTGEPKLLLSLADEAGRVTVHEYPGDVSVDMSLSSRGFMRIGVVVVPPNRDDVPADYQFRNRTEPIS